MYREPLVERDAAAWDGAPAVDTDTPRDPLAAEHPRFSFSPSNIDLTGLELEDAPSALLDCGDVQIDSSDPVRFEGWCGEPPKTFRRKQTAGPELLVIPLASLRVERNSRVVLRGERPIVFVVQGHVVIDGTLDGSAEGLTAGPGGDLQCAASAGGDGDGVESRSGGGGGGGGFGTVGGAGGDDRRQRSRAGQGGAVHGSTDLVPLLGGCRGGHAGGCAGRRGAGGGALQISASGAVVVTGSLRVDGGDGASGCYLQAGGTGGGSGGALLLEAPTLQVERAQLSASGGHGGTGKEAGALGSGATSPGESGAAGGSESNGAGGGGGGYGRIHLRTPS